MDQKNTAVLLLSCKDQTGLVYKITNLIFQLGGNIINLDEHVEQNESMFFLRLAWSFDGNNISKDNLKKQFSILA